MAPELKTSMLIKSLTVLHHQRRGQGMGLGLSICYRIVEQFDGRISVRTEPGKYCEFTLEFPAKG